MASSPHIICFGDSLTAGYQPPTVGDPRYRWTPYGAILQKYVGETVPVLVCGICGECTTEMVH